MDESQDDNPVWGEDQFARALPAQSVLPALFGEWKAAEMLRRCERPEPDSVEIAERDCK